MNFKPSLELCLIALLLLPFLSQQAAAIPNIVDGHGAPTVALLRIADDVQIDGCLDELAWAKAARLAGFSQFRPVDGRPAEEKTEVLVWYSPTALYVGIIAYDHDPGSIRAIVANRDNLDQDDTITIYLDTFNDRRRAFFFTVNPLGVQEDGVQSEGAFNPGSLIGGTIDKNPDFKFDSKGRISGEGYVVEVRIPFKSLRYSGNGPQKWGFNVQRKVQRTGYQDTWTDVRRGNASFLGQAGAVELHDLKRGVVVEVQPFITVTNSGVRSDSGEFRRGGVDANPGINLKLGSPNMTLDATVEPDFSQVESDAGLITVNERFALYYPEKRPFFLEGIELFATPHQLVYTRKIVNPIVGGKFTGKIGRLGIAYLSALDDTSDGRATFNIARIRRDIGSNSLAGVTYTERDAADSSNRVMAADMRYVFGKLYYVQGQFGGSWTEKEGVRNSSPLWSAEFDRTGRSWGFNYQLNGIGETFEAQSGYVPRNNIVEAHAFNRLSIYGKRGAQVENVTVFFGPTRIWRYRTFASDPPIEGEDSIDLMVQLRGGWLLHGRGSRDFVRFDPNDYSGYTVQRPDGTIAAYPFPALLSGTYGATIGVTTPMFRTFNIKAELRQADGAIFPEAAEGSETRVTLGANLRPTETIRVEATVTSSRIVRARDQSEFARTVIPRLRIEYQPRRSLFFRVVGEYRSQRQAPLEDARTGDPLIVNGQPGIAQKFNGLRLDCLISYQPTPGTVAFLGYGSSLEAERTFGFSGLQRTNDGFFVKLAYLFRH